MFHYCSREHQVQDRQDHKGICNKIKRARNDVDKEKQALIDHPDFKNDNPFENHVGRFWKIVETRPYMNALSKLATITSGERHVDSLQAEYDNCKELLRLCPGDNMGVRATVPGILLRLGKEQECYDFIKWYGKAWEDRNYNWTKMEGFLNVKNADVFEDIDYLGSSIRTMDLSFLICMMILKVQLALNVGALRSLQKEIDQMSELAGVRGAVPPETFLDNRKSRCKSSALLARPDIMRGENLDEKSKILKQHIDELHSEIFKRNKHYWPMLIEPEEAISKPPSPMYMIGSPEEARMALQHTWYPWMEIEGVYSFMTIICEGEHGRYF